MYGYNGELISTVVDAPKLYKTFWRPAPAGTHADRPSDKQVMERSSSEGGNSSGSGSSSGGGYRPPGARNGSNGGGRSLSDMLGEKTSSTGAIKKGFKVNKGGAGNGPVGSSSKKEEGKNAAKNKARKERQRRAKEAAELKAKQDEEEEARQKQAASNAKAAKLEDPSLMTDVELTKRIKKLKKQLRAIDALKLKDQLNEAQQQKLATEVDLKTKLIAVEGVLASR